MTPSMTYSHRHHPCHRHRRRGSTQLTPADRRPRPASSRPSHDQRHRQLSLCHQAGSSLLPRIIIIIIIVVIILNICTSSSSSSSSRPLTRCTSSTACPASSPFSTSAYHRRCAAVAVNGECRARVETRPERIRTFTGGDIFR